MSKSEGGNGQWLIWRGAERWKQIVPVSSSLTGPLNPAATWTCLTPCPAPRTSASTPAAEHGPAAPHPARGRLDFCWLRPPLSPLLFALGLVILHHQMAFPNPHIEKSKFRTTKATEMLSSFEL